MSVWVVIEGHAIDFRRFQTTASKAETDRLCGKGAVVFHPAESLFLNRRNQLAIREKRRRGVVSESIYPENIHLITKFQDDKPPHLSHDPETAYKAAVQAFQKKFDGRDSLPVPCDSHERKCEDG